MKYRFGFAETPGITTPAPPPLLLLQLLQGKEGIGMTSPRSRSTNLTAASYGSPSSARSNERGVGGGGGTGTPSSARPQRDPFRGEDDTSRMMMTMAESSSRLNVSRDSAMSGDSRSSSGGAATTEEGALSVLNNESFHWEEEILKHATARRQRHETSLSRLSVQLNRLQAALGRESKRRVGAVSELERSIQGRLDDLESQFAARLDEQHQQTLQALSGLELRVSELEARWERQLGDVTSAFETTAHDVSTQLDDLVATMEEERTAADDRRASQAQQIESLQAESDEVWKRERQERLSSLHTLTDRIEGMDDVAHMHLKELQDQIGEQLQLLAHELRLEAQERQAGDDEIVAGLNRYMSQIQKSLQYAVL